MKRIVILRFALVAVIAALLMTGCSSTGSTSTSSDALGLAGNEVALATYQTGKVAGAAGSLGMELSLPFWFVAGD